MTQRKETRFSATVQDDWLLTTSFTLSLPGSSDNVYVTTGPVTDDFDHETYLANSWLQQRDQYAEFQAYGEPERVVVEGLGGPLWMREYSWRADVGPVRQLQTSALVDRQLITATATMFEPGTDERRLQLIGVVYSLVVRAIDATED